MFFAIILSHGEYDTLWHNLEKSYLWLHYDALSLLAPGCVHLKTPFIWLTNSFGLSQPRKAPSDMSVNWGHTQLSVSWLHLAHVYTDPILWLLKCLFQKVSLFFNPLHLPAHVSAVAWPYRGSGWTFCFCFWQRQTLCYCQGVTWCNVSCCVYWLRNPRSPFPRNFWDERQESQRTGRAGLEESSLARQKQKW